jgi:hypothetical protein
MEATKLLAGIWQISGLEKKKYAIYYCSTCFYYFILFVVKAGKNHLNDEITPLLPTGIGEPYSQTISNLCSALAPM